MLHHGDKLVSLIPDICSYDKIKNGTFYKVLREEINPL